MRRTCRRPIDRQLHSLDRATTQPNHDDPAVTREWRVRRRPGTPVQCCVEATHACISRVGIERRCDFAFWRGNESNLGIFA